MLTEAGLQRRRGDVFDAGIAAHIFKHRHDLAERQAAGVLIKNHCPSQPWHQHKETQKDVVHAAQPELARNAMERLGAIYL